ncbi:helix-turn-helix domain-containing protein [Rahnella inusitata]|uniref:helix-turn-helix domain-containing protein n=1 Tax=Rahnella inusitata TaxID=58169 RepID=UPI0039AFDA49
MIGEKIDSQEILNRLMSAYGVVSQKALAEKLGIPANNISGWIQRGSVPGNPIIKCALDTETDLRWLVNGEFANANSQKVEWPNRLRSGSGKNLINKMLSTGGRSVLRRVMDAYAFKTQKELSEYLGISTGTISTWVRREYFPGDVVIACALDTGVSLEWLATGGRATITKVDDEGTSENSVIIIDVMLLVAGKLISEGKCVVDSSFLPREINKKNIYLVRSGSQSWVVDSSINEISNGCWLLDIDGVLDIYTISRRPGGKLHVAATSSEFECTVEDVKAKGIVVSIISQLR